MSSLKNKESHISDRPSIFRLLDLSAPGHPRLCPHPRPFFFANLYVISENIKQVVWYQRRIQDPVKYLKPVDNFYKTLHLRCWQWSGYGSLFETKKFIALISAIKIQRIEQFWTQTKEIQLDQPRTKQFSQNSWL